MAVDADDVILAEAHVRADYGNPKASLCVVPKAWHTAFLDNFDVTWTAIEQFLKTDMLYLNGSKKVEFNRK